MDEELVSLLFETKAFKVAPAEKPFWYTSGKLGPYFINAEYLYGSAEDSANLLKEIDNLLETTDKEDLPCELFDEIMNHYENNKTFKTTIDKAIDYIENNFEVSLIDYISGGERRDWYFSIIIAYLLGKPHITIYKDLSTVVSTCDFEESTTVTTLPGKRIFHIADLLNFGSSFERSWVPAINNLGSKINWSLFMMDRNPLGVKKLIELEVQPHSLIQLNEELFEYALNKNFIDANQLEIVKKYFYDPDGTMREFLNNNPNFIDDVIANSNDEKAVKRAKLCKEKNWYGDTLGD